MSTVLKDRVSKANIKRKNFLLDETKIRRLKRVLGTKTETEAVQQAIDEVLFRDEVLKTFKKYRGKVKIEKIFD